MASSFIQSIVTGEHSHCPVIGAPTESRSQVFNYERHFSSARLGQIINIVEESPVKGEEDAFGDDDDTKRFQDDSSIQVHKIKRIDNIGRSMRPVFTLCSE